MFAIQTSSENTYFMPVVAHYLPHKIHLLRWCDMCISYTKPMIISASVCVCAFACVYAHEKEKNKWIETDGIETELAIWVFT